MLVTAGLTTLEKIEETNPREIEMVFIVLSFKFLYALASLKNINLQIDLCHALLGICVYA